MQDRKTKLRGLATPALIFVIGLLLFSGTFRGSGAGSTGSGIKAGSERKAMPHFSLADLDGKKWDLGEHRGKVVLINYWATWCAPCRAETPALVRVASEYKAKGLEVVGISLDTGGGEGVVRQFVDSYKVSYPIVMASQDPTIALSIQGIPVTLLLDRQGRVATSYAGAINESALKSDIERLLGEKGDE